MRHAAVLIALLIGFAAAARAEVVDIDNAELARLMSAGVPVIDIRTAPEWDETGIVGGSHPLTFFDERGRADPATWLAKAGAVGKPGEPVILICRTGNRTRLLARFLVEQAGYGKVYNVKAGIRGWTAAGNPVAAAAPTVAACRTAKTC